MRLAKHPFVAPGMASRDRAGTTGLLAVVALVATAGLVGADTRDRRAAGPALANDPLIRRVVAETTRTGVAVRATRELRAGTRSGKHEGWMAVETAVSPSGLFSWRILDEGGSERTRKRVFLALLRAEEESWREGARDAAALTPANYDFETIGRTAAGQIRIRLQPKRADSRLIDGVLTVSADGHPLRLEGRLAKSPSFWVKSVTVVRRYGRFAGVALPTAIESTADVKMLGTSTFSMRYRYHEVNGRVVPQGVAALD